jgi:hypothetical protein
VQPSAPPADSLRLRPIISWSAHLAGSRASVDLTGGGSLGDGESSEQAARTEDFSSKRPSESPRSPISVVIASRNFIGSSRSLTHRVGLPLLCYVGPTGRAHACLRKPSPKSPFTNAAIKTVGVCTGLCSCFACDETGYSVWSI